MEICGKHDSEITIKLNPFEIAYFRILDDSAYSSPKTFDDEAATYAFHPVYA